MKTFSRRHLVFVVVVLSGISLFNALDQTLLPAVAASIQKEFRLSDSEVGLLLSVGAAAIALAAIPIGYWTDRGSRRFIIGLGTAVWSVATLVTGITTSFVQLVAARSVLGIGEASTFPAASSLLGDYFSRGSRGRAMAIVIGAGGTGIGGGFAIGGVIGLHFGWRAVFYLAALPGLVLALLAIVMREPLRGSAEAAGPRRAAADPGLRSFRRLLSVRTYVWVLAGGAFANFGFSLLSLAPLYVHRRFGLDLAQAGALVGAPTLIGVVVAVPVFGWLLDWRAKHSLSAAAEVGLGGLLLSSAAAAVMFSAPAVGWFEIGMILGALVGGAGILSSNVVFQNVIEPSLRGTAVSVSTTTGRLIGALGPLAAGLVSDSVHQNLGLSLLLLAPAAAAAATACFAVALLHMRRDVESMEAAWAQRLPVVAPSTVANQIEYATEY